MASGAGDIAMPVTEHSAAILGTSWPLQSVTAWSAYSDSFVQAANNLFPQLHTQQDIRGIVAPMEGAFIDAARALVDGRLTTLQNRIEGYRYLAKKALWASSEIHSTKADLVEIVNKAEEDIKDARDAAEKAKQAAAAVPGAAAAIEGQLQATIAGIVSGAAGLAQARDAEGAGKVAALAGDVGKWSVPFGNPTLPESGGIPGVGGPTPAAPAIPQPQNGGVQTQPVSGHPKDVVDSATGTQDQQSSGPQSQQHNQVQQTGFHKPDGTDQNGSSPKQAPAAPQMGSGGSNPSSVIGQMMKPISSGGGSSPASMSPGSMMSPGSSGAGNGLGNSGMNPAGAQAGQLPNAAGAGTGAGTGAGRASGLASLGPGIAETSARMASGAVTGAANGLGAVGNVANQVAQNVAAGAAQGPVQAATSAGSAAVTTPAAAASVGGAPMAMVPPAAGGATPVTPVSSGGPAGPVSPASPVGGPPGGSGPPPAAGSPSGAQVAPLAMPQQHARIQAIGADGATGELLFEQAMDAGRDVIAAMLAQTLAQGYIRTEYAVSLIYERTGGVTAWLATSEGPSSIPLGVRVPRDVKLAVTDPVVGRELWDSTAAAGGINPLDVVVRHAQAREMAAPGARVLAIASSLPMRQMIDWTHEVNARPVEVDPAKVSPTTDLGGYLVHRCQVAMPWEWRQANGFDAQQRLQMAARHMHMAAVAGHLHGAACEKVMRLFEERKPIAEELWAQVRQERFLSLIEYESAMQTRGQGGSEPARALATVRAAEVIESLRHYDTAEGCADVLYASRLAGAPLSPAAAVA